MTLAASFPAPRVLPIIEPTITATQLQFVHISKTGGTAVEHAAHEVGIHWGKLAFDKRHIAME